MTKKRPEPELLDHVGWRLWAASQLWIDQFIAEMRAADYPWFGRAQANVLGHMERDGTPQGLLVERLGLSKQAVQQLIDDLVTRGLVERVPDPADRRARIIRFTDRGLAMLTDANRIKRRIERRLMDRLGKKDQQTLARLLARLTESDS